MAQELKQAVYVKPNLTAENGKPFQGVLGIYLHSILLIYSKILRIIWNGNVLMQKKLIRKIIEKMASYLCNYKCGKKQQFCTFDENVDRTDE